MECKQERWYISNCFSSSSLPKEFLFIRKKWRWKRDWHLACVYKLLWYRHNASPSKPDVLYPSPSPPTHTLLPNPVSISSLESIAHISNDLLSLPPLSVFRLSLQRLAQDNFALLRASKALPYTFSQVFWISPICSPTAKDHCRLGQLLVNHHPAPVR